MTQIPYKYLKIVEFKNLECWSVKVLTQTKGSSSNLKHIGIGKIMVKNRDIIEVQDSETYNRVTIKLYNKGLKIRDTVQGSEIGVKRQTIIKPGQFIMSKIDARNGAFGVVTKELKNAITTADFLSYNVNTEIINADYLRLLTTTKYFTELCESTSTGTTGRKRISESLFLETQIPLPSALKEQEQLVQAYQSKITQAETNRQEATTLEAKVENYLMDELGIEIVEKKKQENGYKFLQFVDFKDLSRWGIKKQLFESKYNLTTIENNYTYLGRGKSPKYNDKSDKFILNQKCVRWFQIDNQFAKKVDSGWLQSISKTGFTKENDILINSTGEGTIGRSAIIDAKNANLLTDSHILLLRLDSKLINPFFYMCWFNSKENQFQLDQIKSAQTTKQTELGIENLKNMLLPLPPLPVQNKIVTQIDIWKSEIKRLKQEADEFEQSAKREFEEAIFN